MKIVTYLPAILLICSFFSCKKYLDKKPDIKLTIPTSLEDFQRLLDNSEITQTASPQIGEFGCDDYYFLNYDAQIPIVRNCYSWASDIWQGQDPADWNLPYFIIYNSNVVIEGLNELKEKHSVPDEEKWNSIYGHALFLRATYHYFLEEIFGQPYRPTTAKSDLGVPLKLSANLANKAKRSTVAEVFSQILDDLGQAVNLLPNSTVAKSRPSKAAAFAMLARVYLTMQDYFKAATNSDKSLSLYSILYDYNNLSASNLAASSPFSKFTAPLDLNFEVLYPSYEISYGVIRASTTAIDSNLFKSYDINDLRRSAFFQKNNTTGTYYFKGNYSGAASKQFSGPAVDELYLIRAECSAREGNKDSALMDLNRLLIKRWKNNGTWLPISVSSSQEALAKIITERRKELISRGIRWSDLRRLNQDPQFAKTLHRTINGQDETLAPNDKKYTYPIPDKEIRLSSIQQNPR